MTLRLLPLYVAKDSPTVVVFDLSRVVGNYVAFQHRTFAGVFVSQNPD